MEKLSLRQYPHGFKVKAPALPDIYIYLVQVWITPTRTIREDKNIICINILNKTLNQQIQVVSKCVEFGMT